MSNNISSIKTIEDKKKYDILKDRYVETINSFIDFAKEKDMIPPQYTPHLAILESLISIDKNKLIQGGLDYILKNKEKVLSYSTVDVDENINDVLELKKKFKGAYGMDIMIEILQCTKKLSLEEKTLIHNYIEIFVLILDKINDLIIQCINKEKDLKSSYFN